MGDIHSLLKYPRTMEDSKVYCPHNNRFDASSFSFDTGNLSVFNTETDSVFPCQIYCDGDDLMRNMEIYAVEGMNDLFIETQNYTKPWCLRSAELHCGMEYDLFCTLSNRAPFECADKSSNSQLCESYTVPTALPTTKTPTVEPTVSPTTTLSMIPTEDPTMENEIIMTTDYEDGFLSTTDVTESETPSPDDSAILISEEMAFGILLFVLFCTVIMVWWFLSEDGKDLDIDDESDSEDGMLTGIVNTTLPLRSHVHGTGKREAYYSQLDVPVGD